MILSQADQLSFCIRSTRFGSLAMLWSPYEGKPKIYRIMLSTPLITADDAVRNYFPDAVAHSCSEITAVIDRIDAFLNSEHIQFSLDNLRMDLCAPFQNKTLLSNYAIPRGKVSSYGALARKAGFRGAARAVGSVMAGNRFPVIIPCHRVIRSDGSLGGYGGGMKMKRRLLEMEGVEFHDDMHVAERCFY
jgi:methylated-DNA-[protein]-cysteine S-methyltransferase